jgi:FKBP-type peptidyl-prolyl cis-trans isomerase FklB
MNTWNNIFYQIKYFVIIMTRRSRAMLSLTNVFRNKGFTAVIILGVFVFTMQALAEEKGPPKDKKEKTGYVITKKPVAKPPKDKKEKTGYAIGVNIGQDMKRFSIEIDADMVAQGVKDANAGKLKLSDEEIRTTLADLSKEMQGKENERMKTLSEKNKKEGDAFLAENKKKEGVKTLPSGLQYKIIKQGTGEAPKATDTVTTNYRGTLIDGAEFDSSYKRGQPASFPVNGVIPGWTEALQLMKTGSKWQLFIPSNLAYGERGPGPIGPNAVLVFEIELLSIK